MRGDDTDWLLGVRLLLDVDDVLVLEDGALGDDDIVLGDVDWVLEVD